MFRSSRCLRCLRCLLILGVISLLFDYFIFENGFFHDENHKLISSTEHVPLNFRRNFKQVQAQNMSALGRWLYLTPNDKPPKQFESTSEKKYHILIWKHGLRLEKRHIKRFTDHRFSPWEDCSVDNCILSYEDGDLRKADAVLFHLHATKSANELPTRVEYEGRSRQRWVFLTDESPWHTFLLRKQDLADYNGLFNWSMTYRSDSDVPVPYGRTVPLSLKTDWSEKGVRTLSTMKTKLAAIMASNCGGTNDRMRYVSSLESLLGTALDIYGPCLGGNTTSCPGHFKRDCEPLKAYKFYLAFENSNCREYMTEKVFWQSYAKFAIPVILGPPKEDCDALLPPKSFVHVHNFADPSSLADYLLYLDKHEEEYFKYHEWRNYYNVLNEHGYFRTASKHFCRLCEAMNYNDPAPKIYDDLGRFWNVKRDCNTEKLT